MWHWPVSIPYLCGGKVAVTLKSCIYLFFEAFFKQQGLKRPSSFWPLYRGGPSTSRLSNLLRETFPFPFFSKQPIRPTRRTAGGKRADFSEFPPFLPWICYGFIRDIGMARGGLSLGGGQKRRDTQKKHEGFEPVKQG